MSLVAFRGDHHAKECGVREEVRIACDAKLRVPSDDTMFLLVRAGPIVPKAIGRPMKFCRGNWK